MIAGLLLAGSVFAQTVTKPTNVVVDFDETEVDSGLGSAQSGTVNLVIKNTGDKRAESVQVWVQETTYIEASKKIYIGTLEAGESKTLPVLIRIKDDVKGGLTGISVQISFDGFDENDRQESNQFSSWEIPLRIQKNLMFQAEPEKTTYYKDAVEELLITGVSAESANDVQATISSDCIAIIGSSRIRIGDITAGKDFNIAYQAKPTQEGACEATLILSYTETDGTSGSDQITFGLNIEGAGVDFKVMDVYYDGAGPGDTTDVTVTLKNVGESKATDTTVLLELTDPFSPADTPEKYVGDVGAKDTITTTFGVATSWDAETKTYTIPLNISYKVGGTRYTIQKNIGLDASGKVILEIINVETSSKGSIQIDIANIGTRDAEGVKATLVADSGSLSMAASTNSVTGANAGPGMRMPGMRGMGAVGAATTGEQGSTDSNQVTQRPANATRGNTTTGETTYLVAYKSDIKSSKQTTFTFDGSLSGNAILLLEYNGPGGERTTQEEKITLSSTTGTFSTGIATRQNNSNTGVTTYLLYGAVILIVAFVGRKIYLKRKG